MAGCVLLAGLALGNISPDALATDRAPAVGFMSPLYRGKIPHAPHGHRILNITYPNGTVDVFGQTTSTRRPSKACCPTTPSAAARGGRPLLKYHPQGCDTYRCDKECIQTLWGILQSLDVPESAGQTAAVLQRALCAIHASDAAAGCKDYCASCARETAVGTIVSEKTALYNAKTALAKVTAAGWAPWRPTSHARHTRESRTANSAEAASGTTPRLRARTGPRFLRCLDCAMPMTADFCVTLDFVPRTATPLGARKGAGRNTAVLDAQASTVRRIVKRLLVPVSVTQLIAD